MKIDINEMIVDEEAKKIADEWLEKIKNEKTIGSVSDRTDQNGYFDQGLIFYDRGDFANALILFEKSLNKKEIETNEKAELFCNICPIVFGDW
jgi:hypothetical protein